VATHSSTRRRSTIFRSYPRATGRTCTLPAMAGRSDDAIVRARMVGLGVWSSPASAPDAAVRRLVAMQAQEHRYARWSIGQRSATSASEVDAAFDAGAVLRTHVLRPTWHFAASVDLRWLLALTGPILEARNARRDEELGLDARTIRRATDVIADAVSAGPLTRRELARVLERRRIATDGQRIAHLLFHAELRAAVCSGPMRGKVHTYAAFDTRVPPGVAHEGEGALAELARRYFATRGPATLRDFAWWSGLPMGDARAGLAAVQPELTSFARDNRTYWFADVAKRVRGPRVDLVQCYDETIISYTESRDVLRTPDVAFPVPRSIDGFVNVLLSDGHLLGHWRVVGEGVETRLARPLRDGEEAALAAAVGRYEEFERT
jgi:DNA glycosylase AlkZ-like